MAHIVSVIFIFVFLHKSFQT